MFSSEIIHELANFDPRVRSLGPKMVRMDLSRQTGQFGLKFCPNWSSEEVFRGNKSASDRIEPRGCPFGHHLAGSASADGPNRPSGWSELSNIDWAVWGPTWGLFLRVSNPF